ncbi:MAG: glycosyltransferase family 4 protein [Candidatus Caldarchaeum sp.]
MRRRSDVLLVSPTSRGLGGIARHVSELASHLTAAGYSVAVISSENTPIINVKGLKNPSFMITSMSKAVFHESTVIHAHSIPSSFAMKIASSKRRVLTIHGVYAEQVSLLHGGVVGRVASFLEKKSIKWADVVTAVSLTAVEAYRRMGVDAVYIPNAVEVDTKVEAKRLGSRQIVFVGRLSKEKNAEAVIDLARKNLDAVFVIVGDGPERKTLEKKAEGLRNVVFTGAVEHREALGYIAGSDVLVLPSLVEGLSTVVLEAMALKTPVVASSVGGNTEIIQNNETGILVQPNDLEQLAEAVTKLLEDIDYAEKIAEKAHQLCMEKFSWKTVFPQYLKVYGFA